eukprot:sb/3465085/
MKRERTEKTFSILRHLHERELRGNATLTAAPQFQNITIPLPDHSVHKSHIHKFSVTGEYLFMFTCPSGSHKLLIYKYLGVENVSYKDPKLEQFMSLVGSISLPWPKVEYPYDRLLETWCKGYVVLPDTPSRLVCITIATCCTADSVELYSTLLDVAIHSTTLVTLTEPEMITVFRVTGTGKFEIQHTVDHFATPVHRALVGENWDPGHYKPILHSVLVQLFQAHLVAGTEPSFYQKWAQYSSFKIKRFQFLDSSVLLLRLEGIGKSVILVQFDLDSGNTELLKLNNGNYVLQYRDIILPTLLPNQTLSDQIEAHFTQHHLTPSDILPLPCQSNTVPDYLHSFSWDQCILPSIRVHQGVVCNSCVPGEEGIRFVRRDFVRSFVLPSRGGEERLVFHPFETFVLAPRANSLILHSFTV